MKQNRLHQKQKRKRLRRKMPKKQGTLTVPIFSLLGKETGTLSLSKEVFGQKVNKKLLAQAVRIYTANQKKFTSSTKTRGEVSLTTAKWYKQKGTGRARHGAKSAPLFVGGGVAFGPRPRVVSMELPKKMKRAALISALSARAEEGKVVAISLEKASGKTKELSQALQKMNVKSGLILTGEKMDSVVRAVRNIPKIDVLPASLVNAYEVIKHQTLVLTKEAVEKLEPKKA